MTDGRWVILMDYYNFDGDWIGYGFHDRDYAHKRSAVRRAKQLCGDNPCIEWTVFKWPNVTDDSVFKGGRHAGVN